MRSVLWPESLRCKFRILQRVTRPTMCDNETRDVLNEVFYSMTEHVVSESKSHRGVLDLVSNTMK
jgi:hypothetical protein